MMSSRESRADELQEINPSIVGDVGASAASVTGSLLDDAKINPTERGRSIAKDSRKRKIWQTLILYSAVLDMALMGCMLGPSLLDLELLTDSDTATIAMVLTGRGIGSLAGNIISGFLLDKVNHWFLLSTYKMLGGLFTIFTPLCRNIPLLVLCAVPAGVMNGLAEAGCNFMLLCIWGSDNGPLLQAYQFLFGIGCMLAPLIVEPFLRKSMELDYETSPVNCSEALNNTENINNVPLLDVTSVSRDSRQSGVLYGFLIASSMAVLTSLAAFAMFLTGIRSILTKTETTENMNRDRAISGNIYVGLWILFLAQLFVFYMSIVGLELGLSGYLLTFSVKQLGWTKSRGAHVTSVFLGAFTFGRGMGIGIIKCVHPTVLLLGDLLVCVAFSLILVIFVNMHESVLWICAAGLGLGTSTMFATGFTWTEMYIGVSSLATSVIVVGAGVGELGTPAVIGQLFDKVSNMSLAYVALGYAFLSFISLLCLLITGGKIKRCNNKQETPDALVISVSV